MFNPASFAASLARTAFAVFFATACEPKLVVGTWSCPGSVDAGADAGLSPQRTPISVPWSTGFEDDFCGYARVRGLCYNAGDASRDTVTSPVHSGRKAAAFRVTTGTTDGSSQTRCFRLGELPERAYYGAWYYIPVAETDLNNWNLFYFAGGEDTGGQAHGLWDVSITTAADGSLRLSVYDHLHNLWHQPAGVPALPIGSWFHIQFLLQRARDATGAFALYQDGVLASEQTGLITDDSTYGQWYVGNLAISLTPPESTLYVDDVSITSEL